MGVTLWNEGPFLTSIILTIMLEGADSSGDP